MCAIENELFKKNDELKDELVDVYRSECDRYIMEIKKNKDIANKSNFRMFIISIVGLVVLAVVVISMCITNYQLQKSFVDFLNQYEYSSDVTTQAYTITQDNQHGNNNNIIGKGGIINEE